MPDVFDPTFAEEMEACLGPQIAASKDDRFLVGHFIGCERRWTELLNVLPYLPDGFVCKERLGRFLRERYGGDIRKLSEAWGGSVDSFEAPEPEGGVMSKAARRDLLGFLELYADQYFGIIAGVIRKHDPNHLIFGERANRGLFLDELTRAVAQHCDAVCFNDYGLSPDTKRYDRVYQMTGRPILIGEWGFRANDRGLAGTYHTLRSQEERAAAYRRFLTALLERPYVVGAQWFCYRDQSFAGVPFGEAFNYGFVNVVDTPYPELVKAATETNRRMYRIRLRFASGP